MTTREGRRDDEQPRPGGHEPASPDEPEAPSQAAVVGARGFIGSSLVRRLRSSGVAVTEFTRDVPFVDPAGRVAEGGQTARTVFWLVGSTNPAVAEQRPDLVAADEAALVAMLAAVGRSASSPRIVLLSSGGTVYDPATEPPYAEHSPLRPASAYGRAKVRLEEAVQAATTCSTIVRVSNAYGPGQPVGAGRSSGGIARGLKLDHS